jgi:hypothetical protein
MPLIQIDMHSALADERGDISNAIHTALVDAWKMPADDLFQIFHLHEEGDLFYSRTYPDAQRDDIVFIRILAFTGYTPELKQQGAELVADRVAALGIKRDDILIAISENGDGDWLAPSKDA